jgi:hypothetical protein
LYVVFAAVADWMRRHGVTITRSLVGNYVTSLEMAGCSITVCRLTPRLTELWDAPVDTPALRWGHRSPTDRPATIERTIDRAARGRVPVPAEVAAQLRLPAAQYRNRRP